MKVAQDLSPEEETKLIQTLKDYMDVFAWSYQNLKEVDPNICQHTIPIKLNAKSMELLGSEYSQLLLPGLLESDRAGGRHCTDEYVSPQLAWASLLMSNEIDLLVMK